MGSVEYIKSGGREGTTIAKMRFWFSIWPRRHAERGSQILTSLASGDAFRVTVARCAATPRRWRAKFEAAGVEGVGTSAAGRGRKPEIAHDLIVSDTLYTLPDDESTAWSTRSMAERHEVGKDTVARIWKARNLRPWRVGTEDQLTPSQTGSGPESGLAC